MSRALIVMRHAKSTWPVGTPDLERPLSKRGQADAKVAGQVIAQELPRPDLIVVSPARRTRETLRLASKEFGEVATVVDERIYGATWWELTDVIHDTADDVATLMIVGHNPGLEDLVGQLAAAGDPSALRQLRLKFPTSAIALMSAGAPPAGPGGADDRTDAAADRSTGWQAWNAGTARLDRLVIPRG